ncbi:hypothetical protein ACJJTC_002881 [Scirpophaga incertulas]
MRYLYLIVCVIINIEGSVQYRFDYTFNTAVNGWLKLHVLPATFHDAFLRCRAEGNVLASPLNEDLHAAMVQLFKESNSEYCALYTGIHSTISKGAFTSVEGVPLSKIKTVWAPNEPNNYKNSEQCIAMLPNGTMADVKCTQTFPYVCYRKNMNEQLNECGTVDNEYKLDKRTGNCYKFHTSTPYVWPRANMVCQAEGGHLAVPNSETEAQVLRDFVNKAPAEFLSASIGFKDWSDHSVWMTVHGQTIKEAGYDKWAPGEPNDIRDEKDGENCGSVLKGQNDGLLNDVPCNLPLPFICEMVPNSLQVA